jgi:allantoate deiminase
MRFAANKVIQRCRDLARFTEEPGRITRTFLSPPMRGVHQLLGEWMQEAGLRVHVDAAGNLRGVRTRENARLAIGSHLDTVPDAGAFDGILGVVIGVALAEAMPQAGLEVIGFSEEEGVRFGIPFIGSRAVVGSLDESTLERGMKEAIHAFGLNPAELPKARLSPDTAGYLEFHIEQGPVLEALDLPLGIVDAIVGQSRWNLTFKGQANHAGTTPMTLRRDALAAAAWWISRVESLAASHPGLTATVGWITVEPNATNVIAGSVRTSLDVRHACDETRDRAARAMLDAAGEICKKRGIALKSEQRLEQPAVEMDSNLRAALARATKSAGYPIHHMTSGAGHDAMILAPHIPSAMLFLRSPGGISHHPDESVLPEDVDAAIETGLKFIASLEASHV